MQFLTKIRQAAQALATRRLTITSDGIPYDFRNMRAVSSKRDLP
jgi:hypothetical protein